VLGAGMVGNAIALDLAKEHAVTCFDLNATNLEEIKKTDPAVQVVPLIFPYSSEYKNILSPLILLSRLFPVFMGFKPWEAVINAEKNVVDISFFPEDAFNWINWPKQRMLL
jgi:saccharopine dehydrogenase-like NADP-dependent oxidoreductase